MCAGNYGLTITDNNACEYITSFTIDEPSALTSSVTVQTNQICSTPGSATVLGSGGTSPYAYSWLQTQVVFLETQHLT